ncbi:MAG TPA: hypothetical protein EYG70_06160 [Sulfurimonas sp.]|nr:hypothetical protein [Sulfurimonas sp.]
MHKMYRMVWLWLVMIGVCVASESFIVLTYGEQETMIEQEKTYAIFAHEDEITHLETQVVKIADSYMLRVGPYMRDDALALSYMKIKMHYPHAVIVEKKETVFVPNPIVQTVEKKVYIEKEVPSENVDDSFWIALFGLAIVGILFMFLSSDQMRRLKEEHEKIKSKHKKLEQKQHEVLSSMGENIHTLAKETMSHTSSIAEKVKETPLYKEMEKVMYNENELLDVTEDLIKFLRLKSKKVVIQHEIFNFNHVLNEVAGTLSQAHKKCDKELVFDIEKRCT